MHPIPTYMIVQYINTSLAIIQLINTGCRSGVQSAQIHYIQLQTSLHQTTPLVIEIIIPYKPQVNSYANS